MDFGIIGNCRSAAIIKSDASIDWLCLPNFASSSVFARLLDNKNGGEFQVLPEEQFETEQSYIENTNILKTRFYTSDTVFDVIDFMPRYKTENTYILPPEIIRIIRVVKGTPCITINYNPKLGYAKHETANKLEKQFIKSFTKQGRYESIYLYSDISLDIIYEKRPFELKKDVFLLLSYNQKVGELNLKRTNMECERTRLYWQNWSLYTLSFSCYAKEISRSALVLKLLSYQETGAIIAAVTTSLPEIPGKSRNWDYRFCWIRDASMIISTLYKLGHKNITRRFMDFIISIIPYKDDEMQIVYGIKGEKKLEEKELHWLSGHENSRPVRIGNNAYLQKQHDIFGILLDVIYKYLLFFKHNTYRTEDLWTIVRSLVRSVISEWDNPDMGIWEFRSKQKHIVFSKVLCWVALDRGIKIARLIGNHSYIRAWDSVRKKIHNDVMRKGWSDTINAFTQTYGGSNFDAANLLMGMNGFIESDDSRYVSTVRQTKKHLCRDGLMYRYISKDDFGIPETSFTICSFWMVKSLYLIGEKKEARKMFDNLISCSNHLSLFSEDMDFKSKKLLGNFPQGYSHLALIDTAMTLFESELEHEEDLLKILTEEKIGVIC